MWDQVKQALNQSTTGFLARLAGLLPGVIALVVALLVSLVLGWIVAVIVRRLLKSMQFDELLDHWGFPSIAEWSPRRSPTLLVSWAIAFLIIGAGFLIG